MTNVVRSTPGSPPPQPARRPGTFPLGRIGGVPVRVHWSVLIIMSLIAWGLAATALPAADRDRPGWAYVLTGLAAAGVFLLGLLAHEVSHAVVARRNGIAVEDITLWMFGGVATLRGQAGTPGAELRIAGIGPLVSLLIGLLFGGLAAVAAAAGAPGLLVGSLSWLGGINVLLAVFNILPGAPLDGGRLLRAVLWQWRGDPQWASAAAAGAGRVLGAALMAFGLVDFVGTGSGNALWLAVIGWFIMGAAGTEGRAARLSSALAGVRVCDVMTPSPDTAPPEISVALFIDQYLLAHRHSTFPLVEHGAPIGLITLSRVREVLPERRAWTTLRETACPMTEVPVAAPDEPAADLLPRLNAATDGRALVLSGGLLVGIVSPVDINRALERAALRAPVPPAATGAVHVPKVLHDGTGGPLPRTADGRRVVTPPANAAGPTPAERS
jgi:Zn-dependent protease